MASNGEGAVGSWGDAPTNGDSRDKLASGTTNQILSYMGLGAQGVKVVYGCRMSEQLGYLDLSLRKH